MSTNYLLELKNVNKMFGRSKVEILTRKTASDPQHLYTKQLLEACISATVK